MEVLYTNVVNGLELETSSSVINKTVEKVTRLQNLESQDMRDKNLILFGIKECTANIQETLGAGSKCVQGLPPLSNVR